MFGRTFTPDEFVATLGNARIPLKVHDVELHWPNRLLYIPELRSCIKDEGNVYNGVQEPTYNILSYTWGRFVNPGGSSLGITGVNWPVPPVKPEHFSVRDFHQAIMVAAENVEFIWVDVACIPQYHAHETREEASLRAQEIGRQIGIFGRAQKAFAWLNKLDIDFLSTCRQLLDRNRTADLASSVLASSFRTMSTSEITAFLSGTEIHLNEIENLSVRLLADPWFSSLWTLQEFILRRNAVIISKEGRCVPTTNHERGSAGDWSLENLGEEIILKIHNIEFSFGETVKNAIPSAEIRDEAINHKIANLDLRILHVKERFHQSGLTMKPNTNPNVAYSVCRYRKVSNLLDRVYGIMQIYGIECSPTPKGTGTSEQLANLTDEFGQKLVARLPILSQLFLHGSARKPGISWMISEDCDVPPSLHAYNVNSVAQECQNSLCKIEALKDGVHIRFEGECTALQFLFDDLDNDFNSVERWVALDRHVGIELFGHSLGAKARKVGGVRFESHGTHDSSEMVTTKLSAKYGKGNLQVLLLGKNANYGQQSFFETIYGLIIAPSRESHQVWERIGVASWMASKGYPRLNFPFQAIQGLLR